MPTTTPVSTRPALVALGAALVAATGLAAPATAKDGQRPGIDVSCCSSKTLEAYPGDDVDGRRIRNYVFIYADTNNDGVLRGQELRRAKKRAIREQRGGNRID